MSILGTNTDYEEDDKLTFCPAVLNENDEISLTKAVFLSVFLHVFGTAALILLTSIIMFILQILGLNLKLFQSPELKPKDIEFVLVNQEAKPINPHTKFRADKNSRAGGKNIPKKRISTPTAPTRSSAPQKRANQAQKQIEKMIQKKRAEVQHQVEKQHVEHKMHQQRPEPQGQPQKVKQQAQPKPQNAPPRPAPRVSMPRPAIPNLFSTPIPKSTLPRTAYGGGGGGSPKIGRPSATHGGSSGSRAPAPVMSSGSTGRSGHTGHGRHSSPYSVGSGSLGNPSGGRGAPGVDAVAEPDFGPYMRELQSKIKRNWDPPKSEQSKRVVLLFTIAKDGRLLHTRVYRSSGSAIADRAAISAVEYSAPFRPLPREFRGSDIDINFTFDYNVFGGNIR